jgi:SAM-dependent methyltransferase
MCDTKTHWENVYSSKSSNEVSWYQQEPLLSLRLIENTGIDRVAPVIDVGGGASTLVDKLCQREYSNVAVLDVSAKALAESRSRLGEIGRRVTWFESDITEFEPPGRFALWHDRAVFHFLTSSADRKKYVRVLNRALIPGGHLVIMTFAIDGPNKCSGLDIVQYDSHKLQAQLGSGFTLVETGHETHMTPAGKEQKFAYFRFIKKSDSTRN